MLNKKKLFFTIFLFYMLLLCFLLFSGDLGFNYTRYPYQDKFLHFGAFFLGQILVFLTGRFKSFIHYFCYSVFLILPALTEIIQEQLPNRVRDFSDMLAGYMGILTCIVLWYLIKFLHKYFFLKER